MESGQGVTKGLQPRGGSGKSLEKFLCFNELSSLFEPFCSCCTGHTQYVAPWGHNAGGGKGVGLGKVARMRISFPYSTFC